MNKNLVPIEFKNQRIMTTKTLAEQYGTEENNIKTNFNRNKSRFLEGKHYYQLQGEELQEFKRVVTDSIDPSIKFCSTLTLWTEKGAARHAKILDTDEAWDVFEVLEETYFKVKENPTFKLSKELQAIFVLDERTEKLQVQIDDIKYNSPLYNIECDELQSMMRRKVVKLMGGKDSRAYKDNSLRGRVFQDIQREVKRQFGLNSYKAIKRGDLKKAYEILENYKLPYVLQDQIILYNNQVSV